MEARRIPVKTVYLWGDKVVTKDEQARLAQVDRDDTVHRLAESLEKLSPQARDMFMQGKVVEALQAVLEKTKPQPYEYLTLWEAILLNPIQLKERIDAGKAITMGQAELRRGNKILNEIEKNLTDESAMISEESYTYLMERIGKWDFPSGGRGLATALSDLEDSPKVPLQPAAVN